MTHAGGRPTIYTEELANTILRRLSEGESVRAISKDEDMPNASTIHAWVLDNEEFSKHYARARNLQAEHLFDELLELADQSVHDIHGDDKSDGARVQARKLQTDTRKWYLSKVLPKKYGEKVDLTSDGEAIKGNTIVLTDFRNETESK